MAMTAATLSPARQGPGVACVRASCTSMMQPMPETIPDSIPSRSVA